MYNPSAVVPNATYTGDSGIPHRVLVLATFGKDAYTVFIVSGGTLPAGAKIRVPQRRVEMD
jgi:hypothetical protein